MLMSVTWFTDGIMPFPTVRVMWMFLWNASRLGDVTRPSWQVSPASKREWRVYMMKIEGKYERGWGNVSSLEF